MTTHDAEALARAWLSVAIASASDKHRPALSKTVAIEVFPTGVRLVATDSYVLLHSWVPDLSAAEDEPEPFPDESPVGTWVAIDDHGRVKGLMAHVLSLLGEKSPPDDLTIRLGAGLDAFDETLAGMAAPIVTVDLTDHERVTLARYDGAFPNWRKVESAFVAKKTDAIALSADMAGRLSKLGKVHDGKSIGWQWGGALGPAFVRVIEADPPVCGLVMPVRWDFDRDAPREDTEADEGAGE